MRVLVCGGRHYRDRVAVSRALLQFKPDNPALDCSEHIILHGGATGADTLADEF